MYEVITVKKEEKRSVGFNAGPANATPAIVAMYIISGCGMCPLQLDRLEQCK